MDLDSTIRRLDALEPWTLDPKKSGQLRERNTVSQTPDAQGEGSSKRPSRAAEAASVEPVGSRNRWYGIQRPYSVEEVQRLQGSLQIEHTLAQHGARRLWRMLESETHVDFRDVGTGKQAVEQAVEQVRAGLRAILVRDSQETANDDRAMQGSSGQRSDPAAGLSERIYRIYRELQRADHTEHLEASARILKGRELPETRALAPGNLVYQDSAGLFGLADLEPRGDRNVRRGPGDGFELDRHNPDRTLGSGPRHRLESGGSDDDHESWDRITRGAGRAFAPSGSSSREWFAPIVASVETSGDPLHMFEMARTLIEAGAAGLCLGDPCSSEAICGQTGEMAGSPTSQRLRTLVAARLAADVMGVPTVLIARTGARDARRFAQRFRPDNDPTDPGSRSAEMAPGGLLDVTGDVESAIARGLALAPYCDMILYEAARPDLDEARRFADAIHRTYPGKMLGYACSSLFHGRAVSDQDAIATFQQELAALGFGLQLGVPMGTVPQDDDGLASTDGRCDCGPAVCSRLTATEIATRQGCAATQHRHEVGTEYVDEVARIIPEDLASVPSPRLTNPRGLDPN